MISGNCRKVLLGSMDIPPVVPSRIIVLARPDLARQVEAILRGSGHEVYRTPDAAGVVSLVARIRPHLVIIAQDIPWAETTDAPYSLANRIHQVPVILIGEVSGDGQTSGIPRLPSPIDHLDLQMMVGKLLGSVLGESH